MFPQRQGVAIFDHAEIILLAKIFDNLAAALLSNYDFGLRRCLHQHRQGTAMIRLHMVHYHIVYFSRIDNLTDSFQQFLGKRCFDRVNQTYLFIHDQIRIIGDPSRRFVAMKIAGCPIYGSNLINSFGQFCINHHCKSLLCLNNPMLNTRVSENYPIFMILPFPLNNCKCSGPPGDICAD